MNWKNIHDQIIKQALSENRQKHDLVYYEQHHIIPKCMNGSNHPDNLVLLTAREHFIIHKLLCEIYPHIDSLHYALWRMMNFQTSNHIRNYNISSWEYSRSRELHKIKMSELHSGKIISDESKTKMSISKIGKPRPDSVKQKIRNSLLGRKQTPHSIENRRNALLGKQYKKSICPYCGKEGGGGMMKRWHFDKCKYYIWNT